MNRQKRLLSLVLARTLSACYEGSSFSARAATERLFALDTQKEACERTLPSGQIDALPSIPARTGNH